jgi:hypothetical protein
MTRNKFKQTVNDQSNRPVEDDSPDEIALDKASADYYKRCSKYKIRDERLDCWIAVGLYLILFSFAFVVL